MGIKSSVFGLSDNKTMPGDIQFNIALTIPSEVVDTNALESNLSLTEKMRS